MTAVCLVEQKVAKWEALSAEWWADSMGGILVEHSVVGKAALKAEQ